MRGANPPANVELVRAGFLSYEHQGAPAGFVYSRNALHHLPDFWKALALVRIAELLRPGGIFVLRDLVYDCSPREVPEVVEAWLANAAHDPARGFTREDLAMHLREEYSTFSWLLEPLLERAGFTILRVDQRPTRTYALYICRRD
jgi:SAM-dependent methyltransferase